MVLQSEDKESRAVTETVIETLHRDVVIKGGPRDAGCKFPYISNFTAALRGFLSQHGFLCLQTAIELSVKK